MSKRTQLLGEQLRKLSFECFKACREAHPGATLAAFTEAEEACVGRCEQRILRIKDTVERHVTDTFNPQFFLKFITEKTDNTRS